MASSFSRELEELLNPLPKFADPEDDEDEATKARVVDPFDEEEEDGGGGDGVSARLSALRKGTAYLLPETDRRYVGKPVSRKQLLVEMEAEGDDDDDDDEEEEDDDEEDEEEVDDDDHEEEEGSDAQQQEEEDDDDDSMIEEEEEGVMDRNAKDAERLSQNQGDNMTFPQGVDFHKLTDGMDDLGVSDDDDDDADEEEEEVEGSDKGDGSDDSELDGNSDGGTVQTFSKAKVDEEVEKGKAVRNQLALWDQLLEGRIKLQRALATANQLPQPRTFGEFKRRGGAELAGQLKNSHKALKALQRTLVELHDQLLYQNPETRPVALEQGEQEEEEVVSSGDEDGGGGAPKRKLLEMAQYPDFMAKRFAAFRPYRDATLQKWHDKTRLTSGRRGGRGFGAFDRNILSQVEQVMLDRERLLRRTQTRRSEYRVLGQADAPAPAPAPPINQQEEEPPQQQQLKANAHLKDLDEDIFDDDDFYHQLLRELIERRTSAADPNDQVAAGRQWLAIQRLRSRIKRKVDTRASKGRKTRFHVHGKLVNFMAPVDRCAVSDEARSELYRGLFGHAHRAGAGQ